MIKSIFIAGVVLIVAWQVDQYFTYGKYGDAVFAMLRQMRHSFS